MTVPHAVPAADFLTELSIAGRKIRTLFDRRVRARGLTLARARVLIHLSQNRTLNQSDLAALLEVEHPTMVRLLDGMEKQGLIRRCAVEGDRRAKRIALTDDARSQVEEVERIAAEVRAAVLADLDAGDIAAATRALRALSHKIDAIA
jgi:MarR family transcriptional regulator for hemolysin